jgi:hypothetical protein
MQTFPVLIDDRHTAKRVFVELYFEHSAQPFSFTSIARRFLPAEQLAR